MSDLHQRVASWRVHPWCCFSTQLLRRSRSKHRQGRSHTPLFIFQAASYLRFDSKQLRLGHTASSAAFDQWIPFCSRSKLLNLRLNNQYRSLHVWLGCGHHQNRAANRRHLGMSGVLIDNQTFHLGENGFESLNRSLPRDQLNWSSTRKECYKLENFVTFLPSVQYLYT